MEPAAKKMKMDPVRVTTQPETQENMDAAAVTIVGDAKMEIQENMEDMEAAAVTTVEDAKMETQENMDAATVTTVGDAKMKRDLGGVIPLADRIMNMDRTDLLGIRNSIWKLLLENGPQNNRELQDWMIEGHADYTAMCVVKNGPNFARSIAGGTDVMGNPIVYLQPGNRWNDYYLDKIAELKMQPQDPADRDYIAGTAYLVRKAVGYKRAQAQALIQMLSMELAANPPDEVAPTQAEDLERQT